MKVRIPLIFAACGIGTLVLIFGPWLKPPAIMLENPVIAVGEGASNAAFYVTVVNSGPPDMLKDTRSPIAGHAMVVGNGEGSALRIPGGTALLASDGAHIRLHDLTEPLSVGQLIPLTLTFADAGDLTVRATVEAIDPMMGHDMDGAMQEGMAMGSEEIPVTAAPVVRLTSLADGAVNLEVDGLTLSEAAMSTAHEPGIGHGHLYIDGVKIGRVFGGTIDLPRLATGTREIVVTLFTNDHRPYVSGGEPVGAKLSLSVP